MASHDISWIPGVHESPDIQNHPDIFEIENEAVDPDGNIETCMASIAPWDDKIVLDLGAGTGFFIPRFHESARHIIAVEPDDALRLCAMQHGQDRPANRCRKESGCAWRKTYNNSVI